MKAIIIGGGIAGLSTAIALEKVGIEAEVFEAAPEIREVGAGIWMAPNAMQILNYLGVADVVMKVGNLIGQTNLTDQGLRLLSGMDLEKYLDAFGFTITAIHRGRLQSALLNGLRPDRVHPGKRFVRFEEGGNRVEAFFEDGSSAVGDILLAADGIHSAVRGQLFPQSQLRYSGQTCWRGIAKMSLPKGMQDQSYECWGNGRLRLGFSAISQEEVYWYAVAMAPEGERDEPGTGKAKLQRLFAGFASPMPEMLAATRADKVLRGDLSDLSRIERWYSGRVLLLGDAGHATTPNLGQGACQAVEDAWYISQALMDQPEVEAAFAAFEKHRRPRVDFVVNTSWRMGKVAHFPFARGLRNWLLKMAPQSTAKKMVSKLYSVSG
ncbi:MAG TPA: FAD-dependent oxidoreductase [Bacteroidetes bacterium]|nr:FAD-dependent oxidoreductase [Bacteroidota bacterium]